LRTICLLVAAALLWPAVAEPSEPAAGLRVIEKTVRGEDLDERDRQLAADAYREWQESERVPGAKPGNPAVGRAFRRMAEGEATALTPTERAALTGVQRSASEEREERRRRASGAGGVGGADGTTAAWGVGRYATPLAAGIVSVVIVVTAGALALRRRRPPA